jgi:hypothetical protein
MRGRYFFFAGLALLAIALFLIVDFSTDAGVAFAFAGAFFGFDFAAAFLRTARVFSERAVVSSASNSSGVNGRADLRSRSMS